MQNFEGVWAVVTSGVRQYVGRLSNGRHSSMTGHSWVELEPAFEYVEAMVHAPNGIAKRFAASTVGMSETGVKLYVEASGFQYFDDMQEKDMDKYKNLVKQALGQPPSGPAIIPATAMPGGPIAH